MNDGKWKCCYRLASDGQVLLEMAQLGCMQSQRMPPAYGPLFQAQREAAKLRCIFFTRICKIAMYLFHASDTTT